MNVSELITAAEGKTLEFKRDLSSLPPILKTLVAFANTAGGTLVIGVQDDGAVVGVADALRAEERLASSIADSIRPAVTPEMDLVSHEGKTLLIVHVPHWRGPFYLRAEGPQEGVYIRLGSTNRRAGPELWRSSSAPSLACRSTSCHVPTSPPTIWTPSASGATSRSSGGASARSIWSRWACWSPGPAG